ncbi:MAG: ABC-F family ATP-binding cassette domain-containing protein [Bacteroidota bacterium]
MNYLSAENLFKSFGERVLFEGISFGLNKGDKTALIANNGSGKSTLLKILAGLDTSDTGEVAVRNDARIGFLLQEPDFGEFTTINDLVQNSQSRVQGIIDEYHRVLELQAEDSSPSIMNRLEEATNAMEMYDAWDYDRKLTETLTLFKITNLDQSIDSLSGGQKKRLALALVLMDHPDLIILDEPTNHLDIDMIEWIEDYLIRQSVTLLMVTHDRYFLDRVCDHILELSDGEIFHHKGNYSYFLQKRAEREAVRQTEVDKAGQLLKKELEWMRRMPKARTTKSKSRIGAFYDTEKKAKSGKQEQELKLQTRMSRMGGKILELKKLRKSYDDIQILDGFDYTFKRGERIGIIGKNGVGKTSFLNIITGKEEADSGKVNTGETIVYGYYSQAGITFKDGQRVIDILKEIAEVIEMGNGSKLSASQLLEQFMFPRDMHYTHVEKLSGGEKRRLYLLTILMKNPNFLILDEPTNDLDLLTLNRLEEFLEAFKGCLIMVTHDRYFMDKLVDHLFIFEGEGKIRDFNGTYTDYRNEQEQLEETKKIEKVTMEPVKEKAKENSEKRKLSYHEKKEYEKLESEIEKLETEKSSIENDLSDASKSFEEIEKLSKDIALVIEQIDEKTLRWMELSERA